MTTLIRLIGGDVQPQSGTVSFSGGLGIMRQFVGGFRAGDGQSGQADTGGLTGDSTVRDLLISVAPPRLPDGLTRREAEVLALLASGCTNKEIGERLVISAFTVERHISNLYAKIGARGRADATAYALRHGLASVSAMSIWRKN